MALLDERVLILAPNVRDGQLTKQILERTGIACEACVDLESFLGALAQGAGVGLLAEESLKFDGVKRCTDLLAKQPEWSDFPLILIAAATQSAEVSADRYKLLQKLGNITILERPFHTETLVTAVSSALRTRRRQYQARSQLIDRQQREDIITHLNEGLESTIVDRTRELTKSQSALDQSQKLEAIGRLAGGVAHDFNNLMTGILGVVEEISLDLGPNDPHHADLASVMAAARRANALTRQLLAFGRKQVANPIVLIVNRVIEEMHPLFAQAIPANVHLTVDLDPQLGAVLIDPGQLEQVLLNLVLNARDAMPTGGEIRISSENVTLDKNDLDGLSDVTSGGYIKISIRDTGSGIPKETLAHIFEPFYTTKKAGEGTGMGLATAYGIVKQHGGEICTTNAPDHGAVFQIYLPRVQEAVAALEISSKPKTATGGQETILVVEDEEIVMRVSVRALKQKGYHVLPACNGQEALKISRAYPGRINLLLTDVVMPGMNGKQLAAAINLTRPDTPTLYMSGYTRDILDQHGVSGSGSWFLEKAFTAETLCQKVRHVMDQAASTATRGDGEK